MNKKITLFDVRTLQKQWRFYEFSIILLRCFCSFPSSHIFFSLGVHISHILSYCREFSYVFLIEWRCHIFFLLDLVLMYFLFIGCTYFSYIFLLDGVLIYWMQTISWRWLSWECYGTRNGAISLSLLWRSWSLFDFHFVFTLFLSLVYIVFESNLKSVESINS